MREIALYVTSVCRRRCEQCIMRHFIRRYPNYQMSLEELRALLRVSGESGYTFDFVLTGGEPLHWRHLKEGLELLRQSKVCRRIEVFSNADNFLAVDDEVMRCVDKLRLSEYGDNGSGVQRLKRRYRSQVRLVDRKAFWVTPTSSVPGTLPARCLNYHQHLYMDHKVYACPHSGSIAESNGSQTTISVPLAVGFLDKVDQVFRSQQAEICTWCISNGKVRKKTEKVSNVKKTSESF